MFDITREAVADTAECELDRANGTPMLGEKGKRCSITLYGPGSDQFAEMQARRQKRNIARITNGTEVSIEEERQMQAEDLADITVSFNNFAYPGEFATPRAMFVACYLDRKIGFVREQANAALTWGKFASANSPTK